MKKLLAIALLLLTGLTAFAQGEWETVSREADPLKGVTAKTVCVFTDENVGTLYVWDWDKAIFRLITGEGMFRSVMMMGSKIIPVRVGLYDDDGNLEEMFDFTMYPVDNRMGNEISTADSYLKGRKKLRSAMSRLRTGRGYVRFLVQRQNMSDFDLKVLPYSQ